MLTKRGFRRIYAPSSIFLLSVGMVLGTFAQRQATPDNSGNNKAQNQSQTADQQNNKTLDREMTAKIRRAVVADRSLSIYGHNVKIIVAAGSVTLKGPVHSEDEKQKIAAKAGEIAGRNKVTNQLTVKQ